MISRILKNLPISGRLRSDPDSREVLFEQVPDEGRLSGGVLPDQHHHRPGFEVRVVQRRRVEVVKVVSGNRREPEIIKGGFCLSDATSQRVGASMKTHLDKRRNIMISKGWPSVHYSKSQVSSCSLNYIPVKIKAESRLVWPQIRLNQHKSLM